MKRGKNKDDLTRKSSQLKTFKRQSSDSDKLVMGSNLNDLRNFNNVESSRKAMSNLLLKEPTFPRRQHFYPQIHDEVVYFEEGHKNYVDGVHKKNLYQFPTFTLPWLNQNRPVKCEQHWLKITGISYERKSSTFSLISLKLCRRDQNTGDLTDESYDLVYHNMDGGPNFLILKQHYDLAVAINWKPQDRFRSLISVNGAELWREGKVIAKHNSSLYLSHVIRWNDSPDKCCCISPWKMEPIPNPGQPAEIAGPDLLYNPLSSDWSSRVDRYSECNRIASEMRNILYLVKGQPSFAVLVDITSSSTYNDVVPYRIDLTIIIARLENQYYRRKAAIQHDAGYIYTNAAQYNDSSEVIQAASVVSELCLEISGKNPVDTTTLYHQLMKKYMFCDRAEGNTEETLQTAATEVIDVLPILSLIKDETLLAASERIIECIDLEEELDSSPSTDTTGRVFDNTDPELENTPSSTLGELKGFTSTSPIIDTKTKILEEKEQLDVELGNRFLALERDLEKKMKLLSDEKRSRVALAKLSKERDKIKDQLLQFRKEKLRQEIMWLEEKKSIGKIELILLENEVKGAKLSEIETNLTKRKDMEIRSRNAVSKISGEILICEQQKEYLDHQILQTRERLNCVMLKVMQNQVLNE